MRNLLRAACLTLLLFTTLAVAAQNRYRITGEVVDATTGKGIGFATLALSDSTSTTPVAAWVTDGNGRFDYTIKQAGTYTISASSVGYTPYNQPITIESSPTRLEPIRLREGIDIAEVAVTTTKPLVRSDIDKIAYSVESDPDTPVSSALDILRKVPLITVDAEDNVQLQGQSNYKVLVNGKASSMMDNNFKEVIRSMPANAIKDIEVITSPGSRYEAEGVGGIINIITARKSFDGYNGSLGAQLDDHGSWSGNGYVSLKLGKFSLSTNAHYGTHYRPGGTGESYRENLLSDDYRYQTTINRGNRSTSKHFGLNVEASYEIDTFNLLSLSLRNHNGNADYGSTSTTQIYNIHDALHRHFVNRNTGNQQFGGMSGSIDYQRTWLKPGKTLTFSYLIDGSPSDSRFTSLIDGVLDYTSYQRRSEDDTRAMNHTFQIDYVDPLTSKHNIEMGTKLILRTNDSDPHSWERADGTQAWTAVPENALDYDQYVWGVYGAYTFKLQKFSARVGARGETAWNDGVFTSNEGDRSAIDNKNFDLIPYVNFSFAPSQTDRYTLSYTQRLSRPGIWYLNPYEDDSDPLNVRYGNPDLDSEISHTFEANWSSFGPKVSLRIGLGVATTDNSIERWSYVDDNAVGYTTYENMGQRDRYALNLFYSWRPNGKFSLTLNGSGGYMVVDNGLGMKNEGWSYNGSLNSQVALWKGGTANFNGFYSSARQSLQGENSGFYYYGLSLRQRAFNNKITLSASAVNPFNKLIKFTSDLADVTFTERQEFRQVMRTFNFGVTWNFGKANVQVKRAQRRISNDDVKAGEGNSDGSGGTAQQ